MNWRLKDYGEKPAVLLEQGPPFSYAQLAASVDSLGDKIPKRSLVFCLCANELGSLVGYVAGLSRRHVMFMGDASMDAGLLTDLRARYQPDYFWCSEAIAPRIAKSQVVHRAHGYQLLKTDDGGGHSLHPDLALLLTTSGSTGSPKLVRLSYRNIESNANSIVDYLGITGEDRPITTLPMSYSYGLSIINSHLSAGATLILTDKAILQREFWQTFKTHQATSFGGVPYTYEMLDKIRFLRMDLPSLKTMTQAGGRLSPELQRKFGEYAESKKINFVVMYGQTEATARISYLPAAEVNRRAGSIGRAIPGGLLYLKGEDGKRVITADTVGELVFEGPNVTLGYAESAADLGKGDERNGVLFTGDLAKFDTDGYFYVVGRTKRFLKIFGNRVSLDEVEEILRGAIPGIDCACGGSDDKLRVYVTSAERSSELPAFLSAKLGIHFSAFEVKVVEQIPRSAAGKTQYAKLA